FTIDEQLWVNAVQATKEFRPVRLIVALAQCHEVPSRVLWPLISPFITAEVCAFLGGIQATETVIQHAVELDPFLVNTHVFRCGMEYQLAQVVNDSDGFHLLPKQV